MCKLYFNSLLRIADKCSIMGILQFPHSFTFEGIRVFQFLAMAGKATININLQVLCEHTFSFLLGTYLGERFLNCIVSVCLILQKKKKKKKQPNFFPKCLYILHFHQQCIRFPVAPHAYENLGLSVLFSFSFLAILVSV